MFVNFRLKDFVSQINKCKEKNLPIEVAGFGFNSCPYQALLEEERLKQAHASQPFKKNKKDIWRDIFIEKQFLKSELNQRKKEHKLFEQLKDQMDKFQVEELLKNSEFQNNDEGSQSNLESKRQPNQSSSQADQIDNKSANNTSK